MITKNKQSDETILKMAKAAFPDESVEKITELTEGMCNVTYDICFESGFETILKVSSKDRSGNTSNEINLMKAEVDAMRIAAESQACKVAEIYFYDDSRTICSGDYFFMEKIRGRNLAFSKNDISEEELFQIHYETGVLSKNLASVFHEKFGMLGDERRFDSLYDFVKYLLVNLMNDAVRKDIDILYDRVWFESCLEEDRNAFEEVNKASLVHWDMWEGNVFVNEGHVSGIIDWERAMWGEPFMDDRFRLHNRKPAFLEGFGKKEFSENEKTRLLWYDRILYLTMMIEVFYRGFEDRSQYFWAKEMLEKVC